MPDFATRIRSLHRGQQLLGIFVVLLLVGLLGVGFGLYQQRERSDERANAGAADRADLRSELNATVQNQRRFANGLDKANKKLRNNNLAPVPTPVSVTPEAGPAGDQGLQGDAGDAGARGLPGTAGAVGAQGVAGPPGSAGAPGTKGDAGLAGTKGDTGATGPAGKDGADGKDGATGATGPAGPSPYPIVFMFIVPGALGDTTYVCTVTSASDPGTCTQS